MVDWRWKPRALCTGPRIVVNGFTGDFVGQIDQLIHSVVVGFDGLFTGIGVGDGVALGLFVLQLGNVLGGDVGYLFGTAGRFCLDGEQLFGRGLE